MTTLILASALDELPGGVILGEREVGELSGRIGGIAGDEQVSIGQGQHRRGGCRVSAEAGERFERCGAAFAGKGQFVDECGIQSGYNARNASSGFQKSGSACAKRSTVATTVAMPVSVA